MLEVSGGQQGGQVYTELRSGVGPKQLFEEARFNL